MSKMFIIRFPTNVQLRDSITRTLKRFCCKKFSRLPTRFRHSSAFYQTFWILWISPTFPNHFKIPDFARFPDTPEKWQLCILFIICSFQWKVHTGTKNVQHISHFHRTSCLMYACQILDKIINEFESVYNCNNGGVEI